MSDGEPRIERDEGSPDFAAGERLYAAIRANAAAVVAADEVSPFITEAVRRRCAQVHDCRFCASVRLREALEQGFDEEMGQKISRYWEADFDPATVAALRLCDAIILLPGSADQALSDELHLHFTDRQIAELCFDVLKWSEQKQGVSLRMDAAPWSEPNVLYFDDDGMHRIAGPVRNG